MTEPKELSKAIDTAISVLQSALNQDAPKVDLVFDGKCAECGNKIHIKNGFIEKAIKCINTRTSKEN